MEKDIKIAKLNEYLNSWSNEEIMLYNQAQATKDDEDFQKLKEGLDRNECYYCGYQLTHFSKYKPCFHWLLWQAKGLKKKHFQLLFEIKSFHEVDAYLRWVANTDVQLKNINDLVGENQSNKIIETTITYKNIEWSFSCSNSDFQGHKDRNEGKYPHYHFQMRINGNVVISYNSFHILFMPYDEFCFAIKRGEIESMESAYVYGAGMQAVFDNFSQEELVDNVINSKNDEDATFHMSTMVVANEGESISAADLFNLFKENEETGIPMAKLIKKLNNVQVQTVVLPGPGIPEIAERTKHKRGNSKDT